MLGRARKGILSESLSQETDTLILDMWPPELGENQCVLCSGTWFVLTSPQPLDVTDTVGVSRTVCIHVFLSRPLPPLRSSLLRHDGTDLGLRAGRQAAAMAACFIPTHFMVLCGTNHQVTGRALVAGLCLSQRQGSPVRAEARSVCAQQPGPHPCAPVRDTQ